MGSNMETASESVRLSGTSAKKPQDTATDQNTVVSHSFPSRDRRKGRSHSR